MTYTICEPCIDVKDRACVDECPVDCIYEGPRMLYIQPDECVDCAACEPVCPVTAIFYEDDVPDEWKQFTPVNAEFFGEAVSGLGATVLIHWNDIGDRHEIHSRPCSLAGPDVRVRAE